jgi:replicative DNA helicase
MNDREPSNKSIDLGNQVLGAILQAPELIPVVADKLRTPLAFYSEQQRVIFRESLGMYSGNENIDPWSLSDSLERKGLLERSGGRNYIESLVNNCPTSANAEYHSGLIFENYRHRLIDTFCKQSEGVSGATPEERIAKLEIELTKLSDSRPEKKSPYIQDVTQRVDDLWSSIKEGKTKFVLTAPFLAEIVPVFVGGHLWIIAGYTSCGKSTFISQLIGEASENGAKCLVFSLEDSAEEKLMMLYAGLSGVPKRWQLTGPSESQIEAIKTAKRRVLELYKPIIYDNVFSVDEMRLKLKRHVLQDNVNVVFLDYVQNVDEPGSSIYERMSQASAKLYRMAKELNVTLIVASQISNSAAQDEGGKVIGLKGSGDIAAAADVVLQLNRVKGADQWLNVDVKKNRPFGVTGRIEMSFVRNFTAIARRGE